MSARQKQHDIEQLREQTERLIRTPAIDAANALLIVCQLKEQGDFGLARRLLVQAAASPTGNARSTLSVAITKQLSECTYKDDQLHPMHRYNAALALLEPIGLRDPLCTDTEVLRQGGAIYKHMWKTEGQVEFLSTALAFYRAGWERDRAQDRGCCAINAACILDILANRAKAIAARTSTIPLLEQQHTEEARALRHDILDRLPTIPGMQEPYTFWDALTMGEAAWGLQQWSVACHWFDHAKRAGPSETELQSSIKRLIDTAHFQGVSLAEGAGPADPEGARAAIEHLLGANANAVLSSHRGKVGLALSGGGFRAALYHLGVLARLAEVDALRSVEVISTVSGGSVVGTHYYLALQELLEQRADAALTPKDYLDLVERLIPAFLAGVQQNLRVRTFSNVFLNFKMFGDTYTRSSRMGELYDDFIFSQVKQGDAPAPRRTMEQLKMHPHGVEAPFSPRKANWRRISKVPSLVLNTTSLNSGHSWQFTASWMGEPPGLVGDQIDMNPRYRRLYYKEAPTEAMQKFVLGYAVAASAGVPVLFSPLPLKGLYPGRSVQLVDGGVHDNQGVAGLLDEGCNLILVSDASGQMDDQPAPACGMLGVFFRSNSILMDRVRETQMDDLSMRVKSRALQGMMYVHLKQDLAKAPLCWVDCAFPPREPDRQSQTCYGVDREIQQKLAEMRTDLDSFTEVEAYALMASAYMTTACQLEQLDDEFQQTNPGERWGGFDNRAPRADHHYGASRWPFAPMFELIGKPSNSSDLRRLDLGVQLGVSSEMFGKVWRLDHNLQRLVIVAGLAALVALGYFYRVYADTIWTIAPVIRFSTSGVVASAAMALAVFTFPVLKFVRIKKAGESLIAKVIAATVGMVSCNVHLLLFERRFLKRGSLNRLMRLGAGPVPRSAAGWSGSGESANAKISS